MKKISLLLGALLLQLTASYARQTEPAKNVRRVKALLESRLNDAMKVNALRSRDGGETPLAQGRRIVKQEVFYMDNPSAPYMLTNYGYTSPNKGQEFHPSMIAGFPMDIGAGGKTDHVLMFGDLLRNWEPWGIQYGFPMQELGAEIVIDTIDVYDGGDLVHNVVAQRDANNRIDVLTKANDYLGTVKTEKFYTNNLLTKVDEYYGASLGTIELGTTRRIAYDNTQKISADTLFSYDMGVITDTLIFDYAYNANGDVSEISMSASGGDSAYIAVAYYTDNRYKGYLMSFYSGGVQGGGLSDSIGYAANGFMSVKKMGNGYNMGTGLVFEYNQFDMTYNGNLLDSVKISEIDELGDIWVGGMYKYYYSLDNNPDSMLVYYEAGSPAEERMIFHYEPYNTTSVKQVTRNNNFNIYPNPIGATMNIYNKATLKDRKATIMITDIRGARIWSVEQALMQGANQVNIPAGLSAGTYVISITADNSVYTQKVIKQ